MKWKDWKVVAARAWSGNCLDDSGGDASWTKPASELKTASATWEPRREMLHFNFPLPLKPDLMRVGSGYLTLF